MRSEHGGLQYGRPDEQNLEQSLESNDSIRKVVMVDYPDNMETEAIISNIDLILSEEGVPSATGVRSSLKANLVHNCI